MRSHPDLLPFELREVDATDLFGIFLAVHAIPDAVLLLHTTVGCKFKTQMQLVEHDWLRESHNQRLWTGVDDVRLIHGSGQRLLEFATTWYERRKPSIFFVSTNAAVELSAFDVEAAVDTLRQRLPCPVVLLKAPGYEGSVGRGYARVVEALCGLADWTGEPDRDAVALAGYVFDRYEMDHTANLAEIRRLLRLLDLSVSGVLLGGEPVASLLRAGRAATVAVLPEGRGAARLLRDRAPGRALVPVDPPLGLAGTRNFLRAVGAAAGRDPARVQEALDRELSRCVPLLAVAARRLAGARAAVFLPTPLAAAVVAFLADLGVRVPLVGLVDGDQADPDAFREALARLEAPPMAPPVVLASPSRDQGLDAFWAEERGGGHLDLLVGSSLWADAERGRIRVVQLGYPSAGKHALYPLPFLGFNGAVALAQRLLDARAGAW